jgi:hypothetical protein
LEHLCGCSGDFDKDTVVDLEQAQELEDLSRFGGDFVDTGQTFEGRVVNFDQLLNDGKVA